MISKRIGVIGIPGKWSTEVLADAFEAKTGFRAVISMADVVADYQAKTLVSGDINLSELDGVVVKKIAEVYSPHALDRLELLRLLEQSGVRVFSRVETMIRMIDRLACTTTLRLGDIPMPRTLVTEDMDASYRFVSEVGSAVFKPLYSTKARGMCVIKESSGETLIMDQIQAFQKDNPIMYIQEKLDLGGRDYAMVFLGGEYLGSYARLAQDGAWNTTIHSGGRYAVHHPDQDTIEMASRAERLFKMDFTTVDVADSPSGAIVFEVSAFGGFKGAKEGIGIDIADRYADYVLRMVSTC